MGEEEEEEKEEEERSAFSKVIALVNLLYKGTIVTTICSNFKNF
jgi:hypothetical protein